MFPIKLTPQQKRLASKLLHEFHYNIKSSCDWHPKPMPFENNGDLIHAYTELCEFLGMKDDSADLTDAYRRAGAVHYTGKPLKEPA